jgi:hypothetical protein
MALCGALSSWAGAVIGYRRRSLPLILRRIASHAGSADVFVLTSPRAVREFLAGVSRGRR